MPYSYRNQRGVEGDIEPSCGPRHYEVAEEEKGIGGQTAATGGGR